uniref:Uncharacterized protein n=1 Tax=Plectus sambesii TaxID=2011161 RepID=A0A914VUF0_9BILA
PSELKSTSADAKTPFSEMLRDERMSQTTVIAERRKTERDHRGNVQLLAAPAHTLPSVDVLAPAFIRSCLIRKDDAVR